jgi:hypothetical protein
MLNLVVKKVTTRFRMKFYNDHTVTSRADPGFVGPETFKILGALF